MIIIPRNPVVVVVGGVVAITFIKLIKPENVTNCAIHGVYVARLCMDYKKKRDVTVRFDEYIWNDGIHFPSINSDSTMCLDTKERIRNRVYPPITWHLIVFYPISSSLQPSKLLHFVHFSNQDHDGPADTWHITGDRKHGPNNSGHSYCSTVLLYLLFSGFSSLSYSLLNLFS